MFVTQLMPEQAGDCKIQQLCEITANFFCAVLWSCSLWVPLMYSHGSEKIYEHQKNESFRNSDIDFVLKSSP